MPHHAGPAGRSAAGSRPPCSSKSPGSVRFTALEIRGRDWVLKLRGSVCNTKEPLVTLLMQAGSRTSGKIRFAVVF